MFLDYLAQALQARRTETRTFWTLSLSLPQYKLEGRYQGVPYQCRYIEETRDIPEGFEINLFSPFQETLEIKDESRSGLFGVDIGWSSVTGTGDPEFDGKFKVKCANKMFADFFFSNVGKRGLVKELILADPPQQVHLRRFSYGLNRLFLNPQSVRIILTGRIAERATPEKIQRMLACLSDLAK